MRRRSAPPPSAQQMIRDYLGRVSVAATKVLPKGDRLLFVGRTRAAIEAQVGPLASADADDVLSALNTMGDPEDSPSGSVSASTAPGGGVQPRPRPHSGSRPKRRGGAGGPRRPRHPGRRPGPAARKPRPWPHRG